MSFKTNTELSTLWINGFIPEGSPHYDDVWDSFAKKPRWADLDASGETRMLVRYSGDAAPVLSKVSAGNYLLVIPTAVVPLGFIWYGNPGGGYTAATYSSDAVNLLVRDTDGQYVYVDLRVIDHTTGQSANHLPALAPVFTEPAAGDVNHRVPNMSSLSGGFRIIGKPI